MNHAMQIEREQEHKDESHQRTADRQGYANGFKPKTLRTRVGRVELRIPQTRDYRDENGRPFYPQSLERGVRSDRAMTLAVAEMYVQGVSTRKVTAFVQELYQFHLMQNAMAHVPKIGMRAEVASDLRRVFDADEPAEAERRLRDVVTRYQKPVPQLAAWLEENVPEALTVLRVPAAHRRRLRMTNGLERLNKEIKRRTRVATLFPNEASLLRLASAVLSEISDD
jgi:transposase-like protein